MNIFHYHHDTGAFLGAGIADPDPLDNPGGEPEKPWLIPACATTVIPPASAEGKNRVFRDGAWGYITIGDDNSEPTPDPLPSDFEVDEERNRRIESGFVFNGVLYQARVEDRENIAGASTAALAAMMAGAQPGDFRWHGEDEDFAWIAADNSQILMDAQTVFALGKEAMRHKQIHIFAGRNLKNMDPIPADFATNPAYWP